MLHEVVQRSTFRVMAHETVTDWKIGLSTDEQIRIIGLTIDKKIECEQNCAECAVFEWDHRIRCNGRLDCGENI